jgi:YVTN family beta-propeller protein
MNRCKRDEFPWALVVGCLAISISSLGVAHATTHTFAYVTNTTSNVVQVVDLDANSILAAIPVGNMPVDIEASPDSSTLYVANRGSNSVSVVDTSTNLSVATIPVGAAPEGIALSPNGATLYVANTFSNTVSVIDTASRSVRQTVAVGSFPGHIAVAPGGRTGPPARSRLSMRTPSR